MANIGANELYRNNGDGTFPNVSDHSSIVDSAWSTSCALADFNADSLPDLYVVNYLTGRDDLFQKICVDADGLSHVCYPHAFPAAQD